MDDIETGPASAAAERADQKSRNTNKRIALAAVAVLVLIYVVIFIVRNGQDAEVDWVFGSSTGPLVWVIFLAAALGFVLGVAVVLLFQMRRRRRAKRSG